jgi:hypothetical protein
MFRQPLTVCHMDIQPDNDTVGASLLGGGESLGNNVNMSGT